jgi:hypothetical protein
MTLIVKGLFVTLSITSLSIIALDIERCYAVSRFIIMVNVIMLSVVMLKVVAPFKIVINISKKSRILQNSTFDI